MDASRPVVILSAAVSLDGKIATKCGDSELSSHADLRRVHKLRSNVDAILIGKNTLLRDDPLLTVRATRGRNPIRIVLDSNGTISTKSKIMKTSRDVPTIIVVSKIISKSNMDKLQKSPVEIVVSGTKRASLRSLLKTLRRKNIKKILVEGGGATHWEFVRHGLFDELILTVSPYLIGGTDSISLVQGNGFSKVSDSPKLRLKSARRLQNHLVLHYIKL